MSVYRQNGSIRIAKPVLITIPCLPYPVVCSEHALQMERKAEIFRRFPIMDQQKPYSLEVANIENYILLSKLYEDHPIIKKADDFSWLDMFYTMNHVNSCTFIMEFNEYNVKKVFEGMSILQNTYPFMGLPKRVQNIHMPPKKAKFIVTLYNINSVFTLFGPKPKEGLAMALEVDTKQTRTGSSPGYGEYYVFALEKSPIFYIDGETLINNRLEIDQTLLSWATYTKDEKEVLKRSAIVIEEPIMEDNYTQLVGKMTEATKSVQEVTNIVYEQKIINEPPKRVDLEIKSKKVSEDLKKYMKSAYYTKAYGKYAVAEMEEDVAVHHNNAPVAKKVVKDTTTSIDYPEKVARNTVSFELNDTSYVAAKKFKF